MSHQWDDRAPERSARTFLTQLRSYVMYVTARRESYTWRAFMPAIFLLREIAHVVSARISYIAVQIEATRDRPL